MNTPDRTPANMKTVLILDSDVRVRMLITEYLRECGYRVFAADSTDEAVAILQKTSIPVDVVLSDTDIPGSMNSLGFAQWARSVRPELEMLFAGTAARKVHNAAELCEAGTMLDKPAEHKQVLDRIKRLLAAGS